MTMTGPNHAQVLAGLQRDDANLALAWHWSIERQRHETMCGMLPAIYRHATIVSSLAQWLPRSTRSANLSGCADCCRM